MKTITFYSYKGGVGRTLALANIAKRLAEFNKKVCLMDFDVDAPGLHIKFKRNIIEKELTLGLVDYVHHYNTHGTIPKKLSDYFIPVSFSENGQSINLMPCGKSDSSEYWDSLFSLNWKSLFYDKKKRGIELFVDLKARIKKDFSPDYLLIDSRTGISEISGISLSVLADEIVFLSAKNEENINGIKQIIKTIANPENTVSGHLPKVNFVLSRIPFFEHPEKKNKEIRAVNSVMREMNQFFTENQLSVNLEKIYVIHSEQTLELEERLLMGYKHDQEFRNNSSPTSLDYLSLFEELTKNDFTSEENDKFYKIKKSEYLLNEVKKIEDTTKKIETLNEALALNPFSDKCNFMIAEIELLRKNYSSALLHINNAIQINPHEINYLSFKAIITDEENPSEAVNLFEQVLKVQPENLTALHNLGIYYYGEKNYLMAQHYYEKTLEFYPDFYGVYNSLANLYRVLGNYEDAFKYIYLALELYPQDPYSTSTLAEIYAQMGNHNEFFKNIELSFVFGMDKENLENILLKEPVYHVFLKNERFTNLISKYNYDIDLQQIIISLEKT